MAGGMKSLAKETFFYGVGSVLPKLLSWLLSLYWAFALPKISDIGVLTNFYAWVALLQVILTYGMETGFFRFANKEKDPARFFLPLSSALQPPPFASLLFRWFF